jgi:hypothetical protein
MLIWPSGPGQEDWMTFTIKLEQADGTPAEPPTIESTVTNWRTGDTIPLGRDRSLRVVGIVVSAEDEPSVLIVEDVSERASTDSPG